MLRNEGQPTSINFEELRARTDPENGPIFREAKKLTFPPLATPEQKDFGAYVGRKREGSYEMATKIAKEVLEEQQKKGEI